MEQHKTIPFSPPFVDDDVIKEVNDCLKSGWLTTGPRVRDLELLVKEYTGVKSVLCVNSWTSGANLIWKWLGLKEGDEVIIPCYTYSATALTILHSGAKPVMVDISDDFNINLGLIKSAITSRTKAIMPVDIGGWPCDIDKLIEIVEAEDVKKKFVAENDNQSKIGRVAIICDAAHSFGAMYKGHKKGYRSDITIFSFHAVKNLTTAEGGAVCFNLNENFDIEATTKTLKLMTLNGQTKDAFTKSQAGGWRYDIVMDGLKINMPDICAAIGLAQFRKYDSHILPERKRIFNQYAAFFQTKNWAIIPSSIDEKRESSYHLFMLRISGLVEHQRDLMMAEIAKTGVAVNVHFIPLPMLSYFKNLGYKMMDYPNAYKNYSCEISLPIYPQLKNDDIAYICSAIENAYHKIVNA